MFAKSRTINRQYYGKDIQNFMEIPNLIDIQTSSYETFLQKDRLDHKQPLLNEGLQEAFQSTFPIESPDGEMTLEYEFYELDEENIKFTELECKQKGQTYAVPLKARINLNFLKSGAILQKDIYMGDIPLMTDRGTFIINGAERVVVSQIHRSPGVIFNHEKGVYSSRIIPYRGLSSKSIRKKNSFMQKSTAKRKSSAQFSFVLWDILAAKKLSAASTRQKTSLLTKQKKILWLTKFLLQLSSLKTATKKRNCSVLVQNFIRMTSMICLLRTSKKSA